MPYSFLFFLRDSLRDYCVIQFTQKMRAAIVGGGFTGLAGAVELVDRGFEVVVFEAEEEGGGLAGGFKVREWEWDLEKFYHHVFKSDREIIELGKKVGWEAFFRGPETNCFINGRQWRLDSAGAVLSFGELKFGSRLWLGMGLLGLMLVRKGQSLEKYRVVDVLPWLVGKEAYEKIWKRLLAAKFGSLLPKVNMAWFWARVVKRSQKLGYFEGGFAKLAEKVMEYIESKGGKVRLGEKIDEVKQIDGGRFLIGGERFERVIVTVPGPEVDKVVGKEMKREKIDYLWGQSLILELEESLIDGYWLNILEDKWPFLVVVEQTNFVDKKYYGGKNIVFLGSYLEEGDKRLKMSKESLLSLYLPYLKEINKDFEKKWVRKGWKFQERFTQPVFPVNYSWQRPGFKTKIPGLYVANMSMVYPWDRGVNYAVELGKAVGRMQGIQGVSL